MAQRHFVGNGVHIWHDDQEFILEITRELRDDVAVTEWFIIADTTFEAMVAYGNKYFEALKAAEPSKDGKRANE
jgi:hypothetical protein